MNIPVKDKLAELRAQILDLAGRYAELAFAPSPFVPGVSPVPVSGRVVGEAELRNLVDASLDMWLTTGRFNAAFEARLAELIGVRYALTVNSGSSANLAATSALCSPMLGSRALKPGDEVITCGTGFPTTVNPSIQNGLVPVFVDVDIPTYNIRPDLLESAVTKRTRAIIIAHTLGNPFDVDEVMRVAKKHDLYVIEDTCDALGARYDGQMVGSFGDIGTVSFYPAHHITMGEGGAVWTDRGDLKRLIESVRDWGRDCYCEPGADNTCNKRFKWKLGELPTGYDHKYTYSNLGYNLKITDMQASVALAQLDRLPTFIADRNRNFDLLKRELARLEDRLILPQATPRSEPSWFGFPLTLRDDDPAVRDALVQHLNAQGVATRLLFGGNLTRQPYMKDRNWRVHGTLSASDKVMNSTFWVGLYPGLSQDHLAQTVDSLSSFWAA